MLSQQDFYLQGSKTFGLQIYACEGYEDLLQHTLIETSVINWNERPLLQGILPRHYTLLRNVLKDKNFEAQLYVDSTIQVLPTKKALNFQIE